MASLRLKEKQNVPFANNNILRRKLRYFNKITRFETESALLQRREAHQMRSVLFGMAILSYSLGDQCQIPTSSLSLSL